MKRHEFCITQTYEMGAPPLQDGLSPITLSNSRTTTCRNLTARLRRDRDLWVAVDVVRWELHSFPSSDTVNVPLEPLPLVGEDGRPPEGSRMHPLGIDGEFCEDEPPSLPPPPEPAAAEPAASDPPPPLSGLFALPPLPTELWGDCVFERRLLNMIVHKE
jgi:hypothetical protein